MIKDEKADARRDDKRDEKREEKREPGRGGGSHMRTPSGGGRDTKDR
jgi:hypothetical protein